MTYLTCIHTAKFTDCKISIIADRPNSVYRIATGDASQQLYKGVKEVKVLVPHVFRKDSIKVSEDSKIPIIVTFIE